MELGQHAGFRNDADHRESTPTGTIGFMMDCDTTGIEPDLALVKYKIGRRRIDQDRQQHGSRPRDQARLHAPIKSTRLSDHIDSTGTIEDAPYP